MLGMIMYYHVRLDNVRYIDNVRYDTCIIM